MMKMASIHNDVRRIISMLLVCSCILGCNNKPRIVADDTDISFELSELHDTNVYLTGTTEDKLVWFTIGVTECSTLDEILRSKGEEGFKQDILDDLSDGYDSIVEKYKKDNVRYIAEFDDIALSYYRTFRFYSNLTPQTDYYAYGFCVDPESRTPSGKLQVKKFTTPPPSPVDMGISLGFMLKDTEDCLYFYTKPTKQGKLCLDTYFVDAVPADVIDSKEYEGDISKYVTEWLKKKKADQSIDNYLRYDISRSECNIVERDKEGKVYIIFGGPFDGNGGERFNFLRFPYRRGVETHKYVHSIGEQIIY